MVGALRTPKLAKQHAGCAALGVLKFRALLLLLLLLSLLIYLLTAVGFTPGGNSTVQYTFTHKQYTEQHNGHKTLHRTTQLIRGATQLRKSAGRAPSLRGIPWHLPYN